MIDRNTANETAELPVADAFFAPVGTDMVDTLVGQYNTEKERIESVSQFINGDGFGDVISYFIDGNASPRDRFIGSVESLFNKSGALSALNAAYWSRTLNMTDVIDCMPSKRREEWFKQIEEKNTPDFEAETVRATLGELLSMRAQFLAERVDGIFRALSRTHVTNQPEGFSKRMIMTGVSDDYGSYSRRQTGHLNDLRAVVARLMKRDEPAWTASNRLVEIARYHHRGEWLDVDGGAMRIRCYKNGNAHLEIHPDMAWQLNQILAYLHPMAIPGQYREKPKRQRKHTLMEKPLPFAVLTLLGDMKPKPHKVITIGSTRVEPQTDNPNNLAMPYGQHSKHVTQEVERVLAGIGGVKRGELWEFDYDPSDVVRQIVVSGVVPDHKSHQFYPTPDNLARQAVELAEVGASDDVLEPSAGTGALADNLHGAGSLTCIEVSKLHCEVLESKGHAVQCGDFLDIPAVGKYSRVVMNPPFSEGRWQAHLEHAAGFLKRGGVVVAILPESARRSRSLPGGMAWTFSDPHDNQFAGASVSVVIAKGVQVS